jgi:hypothetical protein
VAVISGCNGCVGNVWLESLVVIVAVRISGSNPVRSISVSRQPFDKLFRIFYTSTYKFDISVRILALVLDACGKSPFAYE